MLCYAMILFYLISSIDSNWWVRCGCRCRGKFQRPSRACESTTRRWLHPGMTR